MKISVVMTTYNGVGYLKEQLDSLRQQTRQPDEVLISDDLSSDATAEYLRDYIARYSLSSWHVSVNEVNRGWQRNFVDTIEKASGDIVFLADQDDIWHLQKIEIMYNAMKEHPDALLVTCKHTRFYNDDAVSNTQAVSHGCRRLPARPSGSEICFPGCTFCFRKSLYNQIRKYWLEGFPHDALIYKAAWMSDGIYCCDGVLHYFRRHSQSVTTDRRYVADKTARAAYIQDSLRQYRLLSEAGIIGQKQLCRSYENYLSTRYRLLTEGRPLLFVKIIGCFPFYKRKKSLLGDILSALRR